MGQFAGLSNDIYCRFVRGVHSVSLSDALFAMVKTTCCCRHLNYSQACFLSFNFVAQMLTFAARDSPGGASQKVWSILRQHEMAF